MAKGCRSPADARGERGAALVELALLISVILVLALSVFEFGRGFHTYASVIQAAREGARAALDGTKTDSEIQGIATSAASPVAVTVTVSHVAGATTVTAVASFTSTIPVISMVWGGGALPITRSFTVQ